ncbi:hypothetical protein L6452_28834 [Arctium lappa]|uniref:Uncharacterized protein n=1 Tax=Arctium lappa TaxID=4217 RepID=A0ACB8ZYM7_ARCLA|nr:hypothetical protein L6452_28834 [Arctium lappa]
MNLHSKRATRCILLLEQDPLRTRFQLIVVVTLQTGRNSGNNFYTLTGVNRFQVHFKVFWYKQRSSYRSFEA